MKKCLLIIILLLCFFGNSYCQGIETDSSKSHGGQPSLILQFLGGTIGYSLIFWPAGGYKFLSRDDINGAGGAIYAWLPTGIAVNLVGNITSGRKINCWWGILGAFAGALLGGPFYGMAFGDHNPGVVLRYLALSLPPIVGSMLVYHLGVDNDDAAVHPSTSEIFIIPSLSQSYNGINLMIKF